MFGGFVGDGKFAEIVADHLGADLNVGEVFAVVNANNGSNHLGYNNHVAQVSFDNLGFFIFGSAAFGGTQFFQERNASG